MSASSGTRFTHDDPMQLGGDDDVRDMREKC